MTSPEPKMTKAETLARTTAQRLQECGWRAEVNVEERPAEMYPHDPERVMIQASVYASVMANENRTLGDGLSFAWVSYLPAPERRASTRFVGANSYQFGRTRGKFSKKLSLRQLGSEIASVISMHRFSLDYAAHQGHELADCISNYKTNQACRHQVDTTVSDEQKATIRRMAQVAR